MRYLIFLTFIFNITSVSCQDTSKLFFSSNAPMKDAFTFKSEVFNAKMHSQGISIYAKVDSVFINYDCTVLSIIPLDGTSGIISFDIGRNYILYLGPLKTYNVVKNVTYKKGSFVGIAEEDETGKNLRRLVVTIMKNNKFLSIDEHFAFFQLRY